MKSDLAETNTGDENNNTSEGLIQRALSGLFWMYSGNSVYVVLRIVVLIILARLLTPEDYGLVGAAMIFVVFNRLFSQLGVGSALIQRSELEERHLRTAFTVFALSGVLVGGLFALSAPLIAAFFQMDGLIPILQVIALTFPLQGFTAVPIALLRRELHFRQIAAINVLAYMGGYGLIGISLASIGFGAWALVGAVIGRVVIATTLLLFMQSYPKGFYFERQAFRELMYFGSGFTAARLLDYIASQGDNLVVGRWLGGAALGVYGRAFQLITTPSDYFGVVIDEVLFPSMAKVQNDAKRLTLSFQYAISLYALLLLPLSVAALVLAPEIVMVLLGPVWVAAIVPLQILAGGMLFRAGNRTNNAVAHAKGAVYSRTWRQGVFVLFILGGAWIGQHWGLPGVAVSTLIALIVNYLLMAHLSLTLTSMTWKSFLQAHLPGLVLAATTFLVTWSMATGLRQLAIPAMMILISVSVVTGIILFVLAYLRPPVFLGQDGLWMLRTLMRYAAKKLDRQFKWVKYIRKENIYQEDRI